MSSSTVPFPAMPKVSTRTFSTAGEQKAGSVGPRWMFFTPRCSRARSTMTAFCSYQAILKKIGSSLMSLAPKIYFSFNATTAQE